jgi:hypothetical protein
MIWLSAQSVGAIELVTVNLYMAYIKRVVGIKSFMGALMPVHSAMNEYYRAYMVGEIPDIRS